eukprot:1375545-Rhodomonas_salina.3
MSSTDLAYGATRCPVLTQRMVLPAVRSTTISFSGELRYPPTEVLRSVRDSKVSQPAMVRSAICLRACYAMPGTDTLYGAVCYGPSRVLCSVLSSRMAQPGV